MTKTELERIEAGLREVVQYHGSAIDQVPALTGLLLVEIVRLLQAILLNPR